MANKVRRLVPKKRDRQREPSKASLREMPEVDFSKGKVAPNPYAARIAAEGFTINGRRPPKGRDKPPGKRDR